MRYAIMTVAVLAAAIAGAAAVPEDKVQLRTERAKVEGDDGAGLFLIGRDSYVFAKVGNAKQRAIAYDPVRKRVRISALDKDGMWIQCAYLEPSAKGCPGAKPVTVPTADASPAAEAPATKGFRIARPAAAGPARIAPRPAGAVPSRAPAALPDCPGDPRCP